MIQQEVIITGRDGFLGSALAKKDLPPGLYLFGAPSSNVLVDEDPIWCIRRTVDELLQALERCKRTGEYLVFPSSATVYNKNTAYAKTKAALEEIFLASGVRGLCLRISAGYGPGERHKGRFASVVYQWTKAMLRGERPTIYGDGTQTRDFVYEDDIASTIELWTHEGKTGIHDLGSGVNTSFNDLAVTINSVLGTSIEPLYVEKPQNYVPETPVIGVQTNFTLEDGIRRIRDALLLE